MAAPGFIGLRQVTFSYGRREGPAVSGVDLEIGATPTVLVGPNGAGKSTVLKLLVGLLKPAQGRVTIPQRVGYCPQQVPALPRFTVAEQIQYAGWLAGVATAQARQATGPALAAAGLEDLAGRPAQRLSGGERARLGIAAALASQPEVLVLDEPSASLDPLARQSVHEVLGRLAETGMSLVISSHTAADVTAIFTRIVMLANGVVRFDGPVTGFLGGEHGDAAVAAFARALGTDRAPHSV